MGICHIRLFIYIKLMKIPPELPCVLGLKAYYSRLDVNPSKHLCVCYYTELFWRRV